MFYKFFFCFFLSLLTPHFLPQPKITHFACHEWDWRKMSNSIHQFSLPVQFGLPFEVVDKTLRCVFVISFFWHNMFSVCFYASRFTLFLMRSIKRFVDWCTHSSFLHSSLFRLKFFFVLQNFTIWMILHLHGTCLHHVHTFWSQNCRMFYLHLCFFMFLVFDQPPAQIDDELTYS